MKQLKLILLLLISMALQAQEDTASESLQREILPVDVYMELVENNHPMAMQAALIRQRAEAERLKASGAFDPKLFAEVNQKYFDDKNYFDLQDYGIKVPAWFGLSAKAGYELNEGVFLNPQQTVPTSGLWYADVSLTLGQGLFIDERRAMLKQARLLIDAAEFEVRWELNQLYQDALDQYWLWYEAFAIFRTYEEAIELAQVRFEAVKQSALIGEEPIIDTLEAKIQLQNRILKFQEAQIELTTQRQLLETYLWLEGQVPLELEETTRPEYREEIDQPLLSENWLQTHPLLRTYDLKIDRLEVAQRLNRERLKPTVDLNYKFLNEPIVADDFFAEYSPNNYAWGVGASFPIFLRKERAEIQKTGVKIKETEYDLQLKFREIQNKVLAYQNELVITQQRLQEVRKVVNNNQRLLQAEIIKFQNGESSLFLVNQRELYYLQSREKLIDLEAKLQQVLAKLRATAGDLARE